MKRFAAGREICAKPCSASLPELLPGLDEFLDGAGAGDAIVDHAASGISGLIGVADCVEAEAGEAVAILLEVFGAHDFVGAEIGAARHKGEDSIFAFYSLPIGRYGEELTAEFAEAAEKSEKHGAIESSTGLTAGDLGAKAR